MSKRQPVKSKSPEVVKVAGSVFVVPDGFTSGQVDAWRGLLNDLSLVGLLNMADAVLIELAAVQVARAREARQIVNLEGAVTESTRGTMVRHPASVLEAQATIEARRLLDALGLGGGGDRVVGLVDEREAKQREVLAQCLALKEASRLAG